MFSVIVPMDVQNAKCQTVNVFLSTLWILFAVFMLTTDIPAVEGGANLFMQFNTYENPQSLQLEGNCCDGELTGNNCTGTCDYSIVVCVGANFGNPCSLARLDLGYIDSQGTDIQFPSAFQTGYANPAPLALETWPGTVYIVVTIYDLDTSSEEIVDAFQFLYTADTPVTGRNQVAADFTVFDLTGVRLTSPSKLQVAAAIRCDRFFYNTSCEVNCVPTDDCRGHYSCNTTTGQKICLTGWEGDDCNTATESRTGCSDALHCNSHGTCVSPVTESSPIYCCCSSGYTGDNCETDIDECADNPCNNNGTCLQREPPNFECQCPYRWRGDTCDIPKTCADSPCQNGGQCVLAPQSTQQFSCSCNTDLYIGEFCETPVPTIATVATTAATTPVNSSSTETPDRACTGNYYGANCDIYCEATNECWGHYTCEEQTGRRLCLPGWTQESDCRVREVNQSFCLCQNGGQCFNRVCCCAENFTGVLCGDRSESCLQAPCHNGGTCLETPRGVRCNCRDGFTGEFCDTMLYPNRNCRENYYGPACDTFCKAEDSCGSGQYSCNELTGERICRFGWIGDQCDQKDPNAQHDVPCPNSVCRNGGSCFNGTCCCPVGYTGSLCHVEVLECETTKCLNGGSCEDLIGGYSCHCPAGYSGENCESGSSFPQTTVTIDPCSGVVCDNGGTCLQNGTSDFVCLCPFGILGRHCQTIVPVTATNPNCNINYYGTGCQVYCERQDACGGHFVCDQDTGDILCTSGWTGVKCDIREIPSAVDPECGNLLGCLNGGQCFNATCCCPAGYHGKRCEQEELPCDSSPCGNHGLCLDLVSNYSCACYAGYTGERCETILATTDSGSSLTTTSSPSDISTDGATTSQTTDVSQENTTVGVTTGATTDASQENTTVGVTTGATTDASQDNTTLGVTTGATTDASQENTTVGVTTGATTDASKENTTIGVTTSATTDASQENTTLGVTTSATTDTSLENTTVGVTTGVTTDAGQDNTTVGVTTVVTTDAGQDNTTVGVTTSATTDASQENTTVGLTTSETTDASQENTTVGVTTSATTDASQENTTISVTTSATTDASQENTTVGVIIDATTGASQENTTLGVTTSATTDASQENTTVGVTTSATTGASQENTTVAVTTGATTDASQEDTTVAVTTGATTDASQENTTAGVTTSATTDASQENTTVAMTTGATTDASQENTTVAVTTGATTDASQENTTAGVTTGATTDASQENTTVAVTTGATTDASQENTTVAVTTGATTDGSQENTTVAVTTGATTDAIQENTTVAMTTGVTADSSQENTTVGMTTSQTTDLAQDNTTSLQSATTEAVTTEGNTITTVSQGDTTAVTGTVSGSVLITYPIDVKEYPQIIEIVKAALNSSEPDVTCCFTVSVDESKKYVDYKKNPLLHVDYEYNPIRVVGSTPSNNQETIFSEIDRLLAANPVFGPRGNKVYRGPSYGPGVIFDLTLVGEVVPGMYQRIQDVLLQEWTSKNPDCGCSFSVEVVRTERVVGSYGMWLTRTYYIVLKGDDLVPVDSTEKPTANDLLTAFRNEPTLYGMYPNQDTVPYSRHFDVTLNTQVTMTSSYGAKLQTDLLTSWERYFSAQGQCSTCRVVMKYTRPELRHTKDSRLISRLNYFVTLNGVLIRPALDSGPNLDTALATCTGACQHEPTYHLYVYGYVPYDNASALVSSLFTQGGKGGDIITREPAEDHEKKLLTEITYRASNFGEEPRVQDYSEIVDRVTSHGLDAPLVGLPLRHRHVIVIDRQVDSLKAPKLLETLTKAWEQKNKDISAGLIKITLSSFDPDGFLQTDGSPATVVHYVVTIESLADSQLTTAEAPSLQSIDAILEPTVGKICDCKVDTKLQVVVTGNLNSTNTSAIDALEKAIKNAWKTANPEFPGNLTAHVRNVSTNDTTGVGRTQEKTIVFTLTLTGAKDGFIDRDLTRPNEDLLNNNFNSSGLDVVMKEAEHNSDTGDDDAFPWYIPVAIILALLVIIVILVVVIYSVRDKRRRDSKEIDNNPDDFGENNYDREHFTLEPVAFDNEAFRNFHNNPYNSPEDYPVEEKPIH